MRVIDGITRIGLRAAGINVAIDLARHSVEEEITGLVRPEVDFAVSAEAGHLQVQVAGRLLVGDHSVIILLGLLFVEHRRIEASRHPLIAAGRRSGGQARRIRKLKIIVGATQHRADPARVIQHVGQIRKSLELIGVIVNWPRAGRRILDANAIVVEATVHEVVQLALGAAIFEARPERVVGAAVHRCFAALIERPALGVDIDHTGGAKAVLGRQRSGDEVQIVHETRVQFLAEAGDALGQKHVIDPILQISVLTPYVQLAQRILCHARRPQ